MLWMDVDASLSEVPVNVCQLVDSGDFVTIETGVAYNAAGMALQWNFVTTAGAYTQTAVTPTTGGDYDWTHQGGGMYTIEIPASGGASINNDTEGYGWFTGSATGVLPWRGPTIGFRAAGLNNLLIDDAYSTTRGLAGTALPNAAADAAGGLPVSDAGGLDLDARLDAAITSRLAPTTAGRTLDVTATGAAGIDWGNVENPTTANNLSATTTNLVNTVTTYTGNTPQTGDSFARIGATGSGLTSLAPSGTALSTAQWTNALATDLGTTNTTVATNLDAAVSSRSTLTQTQVTGGAYSVQSSSCVLGDARVASLDAAVSSRMATYAQPTGFLAATFPGTVASPTNITAGTITTVTNLTNAPTSGDFTATMKTSIGTAVAASAVASVTGNVGGSVGSVVGDIGGLAAGAVTDVADAVWDATLADHLDAGSTGFALNAAGSAGDPWETSLPGAYAAGTAGYILGTTLDAAVSSRAAAATALSTATWTNGLATALTTLASHDPGTTLGTSTLTQTQVTGGAYSIQSASCVLGDARVANLDAAVTTRMATYTQPTGFLAASFPASVASPTNITAGTLTTVGSVTNPVDADVVSINGTAVTGTGTSLDPWGPS